MTTQMTSYGTLLRSALLAGAAAAALAGCGMMSRSNTASFSGAMNAASEVPPNMTRGTGMAEAWFDKGTSVLKWKITYTGLSGPATAAHFHGPAAAGANAGIALGFQNPASPIEGSATLDGGAGGRPDGRQVVRQHPHRGQSGRRDPRPDAAQVARAGCVAVVSNRRP